MTLVFTLLTPHYVLQVSDRRLTRRPDGAIHPLANKSVIYATRRGVAAIGYSGLAYFKGVPTDTWIACALAGEDPQSDHDGLRMSSPPTPLPDLGQSVERLRSQCEGLFGTARKLPDRQQFTVAGWQWNRSGRRMRPVFWNIENGEPSAERRTFTTVSPPRHWHVQQGGYYLSWIPDLNPLCGDEIQRLMQLLAPVASSPVVSNTLLIRAIRYAAQKGGLHGPVGPDCMSIYLPKPSKEPRVVACYFPLVESRAVLQSSAGQVILPSAYSPWVVTPSLFQVPSLVVGGFHLGPGPEMRWLSGPIPPPQPLAGSPPDPVTNLDIVIASPFVPQGVAVRFASTTLRPPSDPSGGRSPE